VSTTDSSVEVVRRWFDSLARGEPAPELCHPEIEIRNWDDAPITGPYFGHDGVRQWWADVADAIDAPHFELLELTPIDETRCLAIHHLRGRFRTTGIEVDGAWGSITTVRDGKVLKAQGYASPGRAKKAAAAL
jgi:ketosteroid isomerase-like protein